MVEVCTTPSLRRRVADAWALNTEWLEWPFTTKRQLRRKTSWAFQIGFQSGVDRSAEALQKVGQS